MRKIFIYIFCFSLLGMSLPSRAKDIPVREKYNFNVGWKMIVGDSTRYKSLHVDDKDWAEVTLPHAFNEDDAFKKPIYELTTGIVWYRKYFKLPKDSEGKKIFLEFEGIRQAGDFYVNGKWIGRSENGVMAFGFDITQAINYNTLNVVAARIDNRWDYKEMSSNRAFQWNDKNFNANYGGINKNVFLHITNLLYQTLPLYSNLETIGTYIYATYFNIPNQSATITAETQVKNEFDQPKTFLLEVTIVDIDGKKVASWQGHPQTIDPGQTIITSTSSQVNGLNFWSWGYGYLYQVYTTLKVDNEIIDVVKTTTGFRKTAFGKGMVMLNDRVIQLKGYAQRSTNEWPAIGSSVPPWLSDFSNHLMVESNANIVRWMHVTPWKQDIESCDRIGLIQAMPAGDSEKDIDGRCWEQRLELMRDAIIYNRNNPSILFYESGNKNISEEHMSQMKLIRDGCDPHGGRAIGSREMLDSKIAEYGGEMLYINKSAGKPVWAMEYSRDEGLRKYWDEFSPPFHKDGDGPLYKDKPALEYNHNQDSHAIEDVTRWYDYWHERPGTGKRVSSGGANIIFSESNTHFRGVENYRRSGEVDAMRIPKDGFYANQVMWNGWVDNEKPDIHILGHWNYSIGVVKNVYVVSSAEKVELFINGKSEGFGEQSKRFLFTFKNIAWKSGLIRAVGYDDKGKNICETSHKTAGKPKFIKLSIQTAPNGLKADGADLALVEVEVTDSKGNRCPTALNTINFKLEGQAEWRGGIAQGPDNYILSKDIPVECGVNRILLRSLPKAGKIVLEAKSEGLKSATIRFSSIPGEVTDGLSTRFPDEGLVSSLLRGPTPEGPSYSISRLPVAITSASVGANAERAERSYDDNEMTEWENDGQLSTAWIQFNLEKESSINEVCLKLKDFNTVSIPIQILIDGNEVFSGSTPLSLGYCTLTFPKRTGHKVKIQLLNGATTHEDKTIELNATKQQNNGNKDVNGTFGIIEAEIYETIKSER
jgi:beta-galactosidase